jgi:hypothetical protein
MHFGNYNTLRPPEKIKNIESVRENMRRDRRRWLLIFLFLFFDLPLKQLFRCCFTTNISYMAAVESNDVSVEAAEGLQKEEASRPLYTNSYDLCADILSDIEKLSSQAENAKDIIRILHLWNDLKYGYFLSL